MDLKTEEDRAEYHRNLMVYQSEFVLEFGKKIKARRKEMGLSQVRAAEHMRVDYRHYQNIENGKINVRLDTLILLTDFYGLKFQIVPAIGVPDVGLPQANS